MLYRDGEFPSAVTLMTCEVNAHEYECLRVCVHMYVYYSVPCPGLLFHLGTLGGNTIDVSKSFH